MWQRLVNSLRGRARVLVLFLALLLIFNYLDWIQNAMEGFFNAH